MSTAPNNALATICNTIASPEMTTKIKQALLSGVDEERFIRTALTAIQTTPSLLEVDRSSLYNAVLRAAQDGLLPDGREGALVPFKEKATGRKVVQWMPMFFGLRKRLAKCQILLEAYVVHENDRFEVVLGDEPKIVHVPTQLGKDAGEMIGAYAIARTADGQVMREVMDKAQIEAVRKQSRAADSLMWTQFTGEAWRKTVGRRLCKAIPALDDGVQDLLKRDDEQYSFEHEPVPKEIAPEPKKRPRALQAVVTQATAAEPISEGEPPAGEDFEADF